MKRGTLPATSAPDEVALDDYKQVLRTEEDLSAVTIRNYLSDIRQFKEIIPRESHPGLETRLAAF